MFTRESMLAHALKKMILYITFSQVMKNKGLRSIA